MRRSGFFLPALAVAGLLVAADPAFAHAHLDHAVPAVNGKVAQAPVRLELFFSEGVVAHFCRVELLDPQGRQVRTGVPATAEGNPSELVVALPRLAAGTYTVDWHATSEDTHKTKGSFKFTVER